MTTKSNLTISTLSLLALGTVLMGCGEMGSGEEKVVSALANQFPVAFEDGSHFLEACTGPGTASNSSIAMSPGTDPGQVFLFDNSLEIGIRRSDGHFVVDNFGPSGHSSLATNGLTAGGTSPSLAACLGCAWAFAFQGTNGHLWIGQGGSPFTGMDTGAAMAGGTSPSIAMMTSGTVALAFHGSNGHLWVGFNGPNGRFDTGGVMAGGTSPSMMMSASNVAGIAFQGSNGHLWETTTGLDGVDLGPQGAMRAGTSPSIAQQRPAGIVVTAFQSSNGTLTLWDADGFMNTGKSMSSASSPRIVGTPAGFQVSYRGTNGHLWLQVNFSVQEDQGLVMLD